MKKIFALAAMLFLCAVCTHGQASSTGVITASATDCNTTNACITLHLPNNSATAVVAVTGTFTGTLQFEAAPDGTTFSSAYPAQTVVGTYSFNVSGMTDVRVRASAMASGGPTVTINTSPASPNPTAADPCLSNAYLKSSKSISITSATTTQLVAPSSGVTVYVCGAVFSIAPSATSADVASFTTGTGATCGTGTVTQTGTFGNGDLTSAAPPIVITFPSDGTDFSGAPGAGLCIITAGTAVSVQGFLTYVAR